MKNILAVTALVLTLAGCGHYNYYHKDNVSTQQGYQDLYECKQASMRNYSTGTVLSTPGIGTSGGYASGSEPDEGMTNSCMRARGYTVTDEETRNAQEAERVKAVAVPRTSDIPTLAAQGEADAQFNLGWMYHSGKGVPQDYVLARAWYEKAAAQGNVLAQSNLGWLYQNGKGVAQDFAQASKWYEKAATEGNAAAQSNLGTLYRDGKGVPLNYRAARLWYEKAATQGFADAQANLGRLYAHGLGGSQDYARALEWYAKAIAQGNATAQFYLGWLYAQGQGVPQNYVQAHLWLSLAAAQGQIIAAKERDNVAMKMNPEQLAEAQRLAQQCQARQFKGC